MNRGVTESRVTSVFACQGGQPAHVFVEPDGQGASFSQSPVVGRPIGRFVLWGSRFAHRQILHNHTVGISLCNKALSLATYGVANSVNENSPDRRSVAYNVAPPEYRQTQPVNTGYTRPDSAPNGESWPSVAGYVKGFKKLHTDGLSTVTIDNSQNNSDVFVKLISINGLESYPVRVFFIPAFSQFKINKIRAGLYDIRYRDLDSGSLAKSESFTLQETETYDGIEYSNFTMTLYKTQNGNMQTYGLSENEF